MTITGNADFMTVAELAEYLSVSRGTAYALAHRGDVPAVKLRGTWRISRRALETQLETTDGEGRVQLSSPITRAEVSAIAAETFDRRLAVFNACMNIPMDSDGRDYTLQLEREVKRLTALAHDLELDRQSLELDRDAWRETAVNAAKMLPGTNIATAIMTRAIAGRPPRI